MKNYLIACLLLIHAGAFADWLPSAEPIPMGTSTGIKNDINTTFNDSSQTVMATWANLGDSAAFYAIYDGTTWSTSGTAIPLGTSAGVRVNIIPTYNQANQTVVAVWADLTTQLPYYAVFDGVNWTTAGTALPLDFIADGVFNDINATYDSLTDTIVATWADSTSRLPYFSVFDGTIWTTAAIFSPGGSTGVLSNINLIYNESTGFVVGAWADILTQLPFYALYDGFNWTTLGSPIPAGTSLGVNNNVELVYDAANQTVIAAWGNAATFEPYYAVFNGFSWTPAQLIAPSPIVGDNVFQNISLSFDSTSQIVIAAWSSNADNLPYYSIFNGISWTTIAAIPVAPSAGVDFNVTLIYIPGTLQTVAVWANFEGDFEGFFNSFLSLIAPAAPTTIAVNGCSLKFATQRIWINRLEWTPSPSPDVVAYNIYRNGVFIAQVSAGTLFYNDPQNQKAQDTYGVSSLNSNGQESTPITATVQSNGRC